MYDVASSVLQQRIAQVDGVGQVFVGGGALAGGARRGEPDGAERAAASASRTSARFSASANANRPKGELGAGDALVEHRVRPISSTRRASTGRSSSSYRNGAAVRLQDVGDVVDSVEDIRTGGSANGKPAVLDHRVPPAGRQHHRGRRRHSGAAAAARRRRFRRR